MFLAMSKNDNFGMYVILGTLGAFFSFFMFGFIDNLKGPTIAKVMSDLSFSYSQAGLIIAAIYLGFTIAVILGGAFSDKYEEKKLILLGSVCVLVGGWFYAFFSTFWLLLSAMAILGFGLGAIEVGASALIIKLHNDDGKRGKYLLLLNFFHSFGAVIGPYYAGQFIEMDINWRVIYQVSLILGVVLLMIFLFFRQVKKKVEVKEKTTGKSLFKIATSNYMPLFYIITFSYVGIEIGMATWIVKYLQDVKSQSSFLSSTYLSLFFACIMIGRLIGSFIVDRLGYIKVMIVCTIFAFISLMTGTMTENNLAFFLPLTGLFLSIMFPTLAAAVSAISNKHVNIRLGFLFAFAGMGGMFGPYILGFFSDIMGLASAFVFILPVLCFTMLLPLLIIHIRSVKTKQIRQVYEKELYCTPFKK